MEDFFPEMLQCTWIINTPFMLRAVLKLGLAFVNPITRAKFKIHGDVPYEAMAKEGITKASLPKYLGGTGPDPPGYHYRKNVANSANLVLKFEAPAGRGFKWDCEVLKRDIFLTIKLTIAGGKEQTIVNKKKLKGEEACFTGSHAGGGAHASTLTVIFDNTHSSWYTKDVAYEVCVV